MLTGFPPIASVDARILILGSMPSRESLSRQQYYAHPRNAFWPLITAMLEADDRLDYPARCSLLREHQIALWDVLAGCEREGSLDSAIRDDSIEVNDFAGFFDRHQRIRRVFFNGARAQQEYRRRVLPTLPGPARELELLRLPSTSPAMASLSREEKLRAWSEILNHGDSIPN